MNHMLDKIIDKLHVKIVCVGQVRFIRTTAAKKIQAIYRVVCGQIFQQQIPFVGRGSRSQIVNKQERRTASCFCIIDLTETPVIKSTFMFIQQIFNRGKSLGTAIDDVKRANSQSGHENAGFDFLLHKNSFLRNIVLYRSL